MRVFIDLDSLFLVESATTRSPIDTLRFKRGTSPKLELQFVRNGEPELLPSGSVIRFGTKETGKYDGEFLVFTDEFTEPGSAEGFYTARPSFNTEQINAELLSPDGDENNDIESVTLMSEFSWRLGGDPPEKSQTFEVVVDNAVDNGDEVAPSEAGPSLDTRISALEAMDTLVSVESRSTTIADWTYTGTGPTAPFQYKASHPDFAGTIAQWEHNGNVVAEVNYLGQFIGDGSILSWPNISIFLDALALDAANGRAALGFSSFGESLIDDADAATARNTLGASSGVWPLTLGGRGAAKLPAFKAQFGGVAQSVPNDTFTKVLFDTEVEDTDGIFVPWNGSSGAQVTPNEAGLYCFGGTINLTALPDGCRVVVTLYKNGSEVSRVFDGNGGAAGNLAGTGSTLIRANGTTDYFELYVYHVAGISKSLESGLFTSFWGFFVRP